MWKKKVVKGLSVNVCCESEVVRKKRTQPWKLEDTLYLSLRSKHQSHSIFRRAPTTRMAGTTISKTTVTIDVVAQDF